MPASDKERVLSSWKEISSYLGRAVRTVQTWEREEGLPVHRHKHRTGGTVYADPSEIDAWLQGREELVRSDPGATAWLRRRPWLVAAVVAALAIGAAVAWRFGFYTSHASMAFEERDWLLIANFDNRSGEEIYESGVQAALTRALSNSRFVNVVPPERVSDTLRLMRQPPDTRVDRALAREVAARDGGIRALLIGRVDKLGTAWVLSADLVDPRDGVTVASLSEEAQGEEALLPAIHRLSSRVRQALGEALSTIQKGEEDLRKVSTPSLRALELYSKADRLFEQQNLGGADRNQAAEALLREAIAEDPDFGSAYTHLAYAIKRQGRPPEEYLPYAEKATELTDRATAVERYFIRGSYHRFRDEYEEAVAQYTALLEIEPDHFWANNNVSAHLISLGRHEEALEYVLRLVELRPNSFTMVAYAVPYLVNLGGHLEEAKAYAEHAEKLWQEEADHRPRGSEVRLRAHLDFLPIHELWLQGDLEGVLREVDRTVKSLREQPPPAAAVELGIFATHYYADLGMLEKPREIPTHREPGREWRWEFWKAWRTGDRESLKELILSDDRRTPLWLSRHAVDLAQLGFVAEADQFLAELELVGHSDRGVEGRISTCRGTLAFARGSFDEAIPLLEEGLPVLRAAPNLAEYFLGVETLALAWDAIGQSEQGVRVLEEASREKSSVMVNKFHWMKAQLRLAELYRKVGREAEALAVEEELRRLTVYADPEFLIVQELRSREQPVPVGAG